MKGNSQYARILNDLRLARGGWVCGTLWLQNYMPRYAAVIYDLRTDKFEIESEKCIMHNPVETTNAKLGHNVYMYRLVREPNGVQPQEQMSWI